MTIAQQQSASIALNEIIPASVDFSDSPMRTGEINLRTKFFLLGNADVTTPFFNHFLSPYREQGSHIFCVDTDGSFRETFQQLGAKMFQHKNERPLSFNPFLPIEKDLESREQRQARILMAIWKPELDWFFNRHEVGIPGYLELQVVQYAVRGYNRLWDDCPDMVIGFNSFYEYLKGDFRIFLNDFPRFTAVDYNGLLETLLPYYTGGSLAYLLNSETPFRLATSEEVFHVDLSELCIQPALQNLVAHIALETIAPELKTRGGIRKIILCNKSLSDLNQRSGWGTYRQLLKDCRVQFGECWLVTKATELAERMRQEIADNPFVRNFQTTLLVHPASLGSSTQINYYLQFLSSLVEGRTIDTDTIDLMLSQPHRIGLYSLTQKQLRAFILPIDA